MRTEQKFGTTYRYPESIDELAGRIISFDYQSAYLIWDTVYYQIYKAEKTENGYLLHGSIMDTYDDLVADDFAHMKGTPFAFIPEESIADLLSLKPSKGKRYYPGYPLPETDTYWELYYGNVEEFIALYETD